MTHTRHDVDPTETQEWVDSIASVIRAEGAERTQFLIQKVLHQAYLDGIVVDGECFRTPYVNSIPKEKETPYPGDLPTERRIASVVRWNAAMMVLRASRKQLDLGGHISSFQSASTVYEVCFNHFFRASTAAGHGDAVFFQGHASPGIYSRAFVEGRLTVRQLDHFRQEVSGGGLSSYPHPKLMPRFWQFPTVSMGIGALNAIYQARFLKYVQHRGLQNTDARTVYAFLGDGEMDEPESKGAVTVAGREKLDNLIFVVNCNLQRLDGPVYGNGKIIVELERFFVGANWKVIKVIWGSRWDELFAKDTHRRLMRLVDETLDGQYQNLWSHDGRCIRRRFFDAYAETRALVRGMSDEQVLSLNLGGHDPQKIYSALRAANCTRGRPVVVLVHTVKGYGMGKPAEGANVAHQVKDMGVEELKRFRDRLRLKISDREVASLPYLSFDSNSSEHEYLHRRRMSLGGYVPTRRTHSTASPALPTLGHFSVLLQEQRRRISTTMAFVRALNILLNDPSFGSMIVPILADEARTFGMEGLFRKIGIYNPKGQRYIPQDRSSLAYYREDCRGQILQEGINELGAASSWLAAATSYSTNDLVTIPFYVFYSMFGFQRTGDLLWAAGDQQAKGFLIGGTSGRTTLNGEGLQHQDGHSHVYALTVPSCISYDLAYAYEVAVVLQHGMVRMHGKRPENVYFYLTVSNENYRMPSMPKQAEEGIRRGIYCVETRPGAVARVQLLGSGPILRLVRKAARILSEEYDVRSQVYSVTSFTELARDGHDCERWNRLHPDASPRVPYVTQVLDDSPIVASTDYMRAYSEQIARFVPTRRFCVLGTDGFGRSDSRTNLRSYFEIDAPHIVLSALHELMRCGQISAACVRRAIVRFGVDVDQTNPRSFAQVNS